MLLLITVLHAACQVLTKSLLVKHYINQVQVSQYIVGDRRGFWQMQVLEQNLRYDIKYICGILTIIVKLYTIDLME